MLLILVPSFTNRLIYITDIFFKTLIPTEFKLTTDENEFELYQGSKITYGTKTYENICSIPSQGILFEEQIKQQPIKIGEWSRNKIFFQVQGFYILPFDIFGAAFYLVTRYEEYLPHKQDRFERFRPESSLSFKYNFLERPLINIWAQDFKKLIEKYNSNISFKVTAHEFEPTINVENAFAYKHKNLKESLKKVWESIKKFKIANAKNKAKIIFGAHKDPFDTFEKIDKINSQFNIKPTYFFSVNHDQITISKNYTNAVNKLIKNHDQKYEIGLLASHDTPTINEKLTIEIDEINKNLDNPVIFSRQMSTRLNIPITYQNLIKNGIEKDYSMGYSSHIGFRASIASKFYFFDLTTNKQTNLLICPFAAMDSALRFHQRTYYKDVINILKPMSDEVKGLGGYLSFVFHNEGVGGERNWKKWGDIYLDVLRFAI